MPKIIKKEETIVYEGVSLRDILKDDFIKKIKDRKLEIEPISVVFITTEEEDKKEVPYPIILLHQNKKEIEEKIIHIHTEKNKRSEEFIKVLGDFETK